MSTFKSRPRPSLVFAIFLAAFGGTAEEANWPHWRGSHDNGSTAQGTYVVQWDTNNVLWKSPLPGKGCSTPIVWDKRIFLTAPTNGSDAVLAFGWDGKPLWQTTLGLEHPGTHRNGSGSNPSPITDGQSVFVYFKSGALAALSLEGSLRWQTNLVAGFGPDTLYWDQGTSPVLTKGNVLIVRMHHGESWLAAFDQVTGTMRWKVPRNYETPEEGDNAYTTPLVIREQSKEAILIWGGQHLTAHDATDGTLLWSCGDFNPQAVANWTGGGFPGHRWRRCGGGMRSSGSWPTASLRYSTRRHRGRNRHGPSLETGGYWDLCAHTWGIQRTHLSAARPRRSRMPWSDDGQNAVAKRAAES